jgi:hypothetical protein
VLDKMFDFSGPMQPPLVLSPKTGNPV